MGKLSIEFENRTAPTNLEIQKMKTRKLLHETHLIYRNVLRLFSRQIRRDPWSFPLFPLRPRRRQVMNVTLTFVTSTLIVRLRRTRYNSKRRTTLAYLFEVSLIILLSKHWVLNTVLLTFWYGRSRSLILILRTCNILMRNSGSRTLTLEKPLDRSLQKVAIRRRIGLKALLHLKVTFVNHL